MRIPKLISSSFNNDRFNLLFETGESRYFIISDLVEILNSQGVGTFEVKDITKSIVKDGIVTFPSIKLKVLTPDGVRQELYDLSPDFIYNESKSSEVSIGEVFRMLRELKKISQQAIAEKCGTSKGYISKFEASKSQIEWNTLRKLFFMGLGIKLDPSMLVVFAQGFNVTSNQAQGQASISVGPSLERSWLSNVGKVDYMNKFYFESAAIAAPFTDLPVLRSKGHVELKVAGLSWEN